MKKKLAIIPLIAILLCTNITVFAQEHTGYEKEITVYNEECSISRFALATDIQSITMTQTGTQIIPTTPFKEGLVQNAEVIYRFTYKVTAKRYNGQTVTNTPIQFITFTGPIKGYKFTTINSSGVGYIDIDVRGANSFTLSCGIGSARSNGINKTPTVKAQYQSTFYCTGYIVALESDYKDSKVSAPGITDAKFSQKFLDTTKMNGTGLTDSKKYIKFNGSTFYYVSEPLTATGTTPTPGRTIAVDPYYIPRAKPSTVWKRATVSIGNLGNRVAEDGGGAITGYRIDVFMGLGISSMATWSNGNKVVTLISVN